MRLNVTELGRGSKVLNHSYRPEELVLDEETQLVEPLEVSLRAQSNGVEVRIRGQIKGKVEVLCHRCLKPIPMPVEIETDVAFIPADQYGEGESAAELTEDEMEFSVFEGDELDIEDLVREQVLLSIPGRLLCSEHCRGLCPHCGTDLNSAECGCEQQETDPRWSGLSALKESR
ncbi:MAG: DUF177 domain-containing protein [Pyrinomonadaceae bacterium]|nr:DUF177 domain-containing protein [Pyrinomonadaceae bacterium]